MATHCPEGCILVTTRKSEGPLYNVIPCSQRKSPPLSAKSTPRQRHRDGWAKHILKTEGNNGGGGGSVPAIPSISANLLTWKTQEGQTQIVCFDSIFKGRLVLQTWEANSRHLGSNASFCITTKPWSELNGSLWKGLRSLHVITSNAAWHQIAPTRSEAGSYLPPLASPLPRVWASQMNQIWLWFQESLAVFRALLKEKI